MHALQVEAMSIGAYDYVTKPFNIFELRSTIGRVAERRKLARKEISRCCGTQFDPEIVKCFLDIPEQVWSDIPG